MTKEIPITKETEEIVIERELKQEKKKCAQLILELRAAKKNANEWADKAIKSREELCEYLRNEINGLGGGTKPSPGSAKRPAKLILLPQSD